MMKTLLLGAGNSRKKRIVSDLSPDRGFDELVTLDLQDADVLHDLDELPYPFSDAEFDEIHAYEVLEHCGLQGDVGFFFGQFNELRRILVPGGVLCGSVPSDNPWGDPGHRRVLTVETLSYLTRQHYDQLGKTSCADYRHLIKGWWHLASARVAGGSLYFQLQAV
jgi:hypothetical protein